VTVRLVLDTSAICAYAAGSIHVGEVLAELEFEGVRAALPLLCLIEAGTTVKDQRLLDVLAEHPVIGLAEMEFAGWRQISAAATILGTIGRACAALPVVRGQAGYVLTADPHVYETAGIDCIAV